MSNRKYSRLAEGYHDRSQYHPYQTGSKYSSKNHSNCVSDSRERSPNNSGSGSRGSSPYSSRHSNNSPRLIRSKSTHSRSRESGKKGSSKSPSDSAIHTRHSNNVQNTEKHYKFNHVNDDFPWSQHTSSSGKLYYYNCKTEKSQWEKPKEWFERENQEKERKDREKKELLLSRDSKHSNGSREYGYTTRDTDLSRNANLSKLSRSGVSKGQKEYSSPKDGRDRRPDIHQLDSRTHCYSDNKKKEYNSPSTVYISDSRGNSVVKTSSANTTALPTSSLRSAPIAASLVGEETVSPVGSVQDVSPPSTPSSRPGSLDSVLHGSSPQLPTLSPLVTQFHSSQSPNIQLPQNQQLQQYSNRQPNLPVQNVLTQTPVSNCPMTVPGQYSYNTSQQSFTPQMCSMASNLGQYSFVNQGLPSLQQPKQPHPMLYGNSSVPTASASPQTVFDNQVRQPALHPLQQATLLQQRQLLSEVDHHQPAVGNTYNTSYTAGQTLSSHHHSVVPAMTHPAAMPVPGSAVHQVKESEQKSHSASGSPLLYAHSNITKDQASSQAVPLPPLASLSNSQSHPGPSLSVSSQPSPPLLNLQSLAKYTDKNYTNLIAGWPSELIEKQIQRCWDDSTCHLSESAKTCSDHLETLSQLSFMELRLDVGAKRISQLKEMTKTLEVLLEGSDAKSLM